MEKRTSDFGPTPMVITAKKVSMLTAEGGGKTTTRNSSYLKKLHADFMLLNKKPLTATLKTKIRRTKILTSIITSCQKKTGVIEAD